MGKRVVAAIVLAASLSFGCSDTGFSSSGGSSGFVRPARVSQPTSGPAQAQGNGASPTVPISGPQSMEPPSQSTQRPSPRRDTDEREPVSAVRPPPPISGGTLLVSRDGKLAIAADPDRDRLVVVDLAAAMLVAQLELEPGDEPGRLVEDESARVHVALRGSGQLLSVELSSMQAIERREVCAAPRGVGYDARLDLVHVACMDGLLVSLPAAGGDVTRSLPLAVDLRDVVVGDHALHVSRFRSAHLLSLDAAGELQMQRSARVVTQLIRESSAESPLQHSFAPTLARRSLRLRDDSVAVLHQRSLLDSIDLGQPETSSAQTPGAYARGAFACSGIVQAGVSVFAGDEESPRHTLSLAGAVLPIDIAASPDGRTLAIADAGRQSTLADVASSDPASSFVSLVDLQAGALTDSSALGADCVSTGVSVNGQAIAVAYSHDGSLLVQTRQPARLQILGAGAARVVELGGVGVVDTGHDLFHLDAGGGIACAGCHAEGGDDGHVWSFSELGLRRTLPLHSGLQGTRPFHWGGEIADFAMLVDEVFVRRMGGAPQSQARVDALSSWLFSLPSPPPMRALDDEAAERGAALFASRQSGCATCHDGDKLTSNETVAVGGQGLQVPSLLGVAYRTPLMHDGCAVSLRATFVGECAGDEHRAASELSEDEIADLVAFLETL